MNQSSKTGYKPPVPQWVNITHQGRLLCRFDKARGLMEIKVFKTNEMILVDLAEAVAAHEQRMAANNENCNLASI
jgi:hypothetical protein